MRLKQHSDIRMAGTCRQTDRQTNKQQWRFFLHEGRGLVVGPGPHGVAGLPARRGRREWEEFSQVRDSKSTCMCKHVTVRMMYA